jgi:hypothetical protein
MEWEEGNSSTAIKVLVAATADSQVDLSESALLSRHAEMPAYCVLLHQLHSRKRPMNIHPRQKFFELDSTTRPNLKLLFNLVLLSRSYEIATTSHTRQLSSLSSPKVSTKQRKFSKDISSDSTVRTPSVLQNMKRCLCSMPKFFTATRPRVLTNLLNFEISSNGQSRSTRTIHSSSAYSITTSVSYSLPTVLSILTSRLIGFTHYSSNEDSKSYSQDARRIRPQGEGCYERWLPIRHLRRTPPRC